MFAVVIKIYYKNIYNIKIKKKICCYEKKQRIILIKGPKLKKKIGCFYFLSSATNVQNTRLYKGFHRDRCVLKRYLGHVQFRTWKIVCSSFPVAIYRSDNRLNSLFNHVSEWQHNTRSNLTKRKNHGYPPHPSI